MHINVNIHANISIDVIFWHHSMHRNKGAGDLTNQCVNSKLTTRCYYKLHAAPWTVSGWTPHTSASTHLSQYMTQRRPTTPQTATPTRAAITGLWPTAVIRRRREGDTRWKYKMENWTSFLLWCPTCLFSWLKIVTVTGLSSLRFRDRNRHGEYMTAVRMLSPQCQCVTFLVFVVFVTVLNFFSEHAANIQNIL